MLKRLLSTKLYPGPRDIFATHIMEVNRLVIGELLDRLAGDRGHIVIRVAPGGDAYQVILLDDTAERYQVSAIHGPYISR